MTRKGKTKVRIGVAIVAMVALTACSRLEDSHGYVPDEALLTQVEVGRDTKDTVARILGRPGTAGIVDDRGWYYVRSDYERFLWRAPVEVDRQVVAVSFAENGQVENVEVPGSHIGMPSNPWALYVAADRLAQNPGEWQPFAPTGIVGAMFRKAKGRS